MSIRNITDAEQQLRLEVEELMQECTLLRARNTRLEAEKSAAQPAQQEPVAWLHTKIKGVAVPHRPADLDKHPDRWEALYKTPPPCPTCEALARTVMLDQTSHDTSPPSQRKPLTDTEIDALREKHSEGRGSGWRFDFKGFARAIEAKLKELE